MGHHLTRCWPRYHAHCFGSSWAAPGSQCGTCQELLTGPSQLCSTSVKAPWSTWPTWTKPQTPQSGRTPLLLTSLAPMTFFSTTGCRVVMPRYSYDPSGAKAQPMRPPSAFTLYLCQGGPKGWRKGHEFPPYSWCLGGGLNLF